jgi:nitronate monooxygenase
MTSFLKKLRLPIIQAPMFLVSGPDLVIASCRSGIIGTFPALNPRTDQELDNWLTKIKQEIPKDYPFGVNLIVHNSNKRLQTNLEQIVKHKVPLVITSLGAVKDVVDSVHSYGGVVYHDVTNIKHARKAISSGVDGIIAVCAGAGGHAGAISPFALVPQIRQEFDGVIACAGGISTGGGIRAAQALGADVAYMGTRFIPTKESKAVDAYKQMCVDSKEGPSPSFLPTVYTKKISGVNANFLRQSLLNNNINPDSISVEELGEEDFSKLRNFYI